MFPLKWAPSTHALGNACSFHLEEIPEQFRTEVRNLLARLGEDSRWVYRPLGYAFKNHGRFSPAGYASLVAADTETPPGYSRQGWVDALETLSQRYPQIPVILWDTIAVMGLRPNPHEEDAIPNLGGLLRHPWSIADAALHAAAKATALWGDINHELAAHSGGYFAEHGCGCSHIVRELPSGATFPAMAEDRKQHVTREFFEHFLAEIALIHVLGFPFSLHESVETYEGTLVPA